MKLREKSEEQAPVVKIKLLNYDPSRQDEYSKNFTLPFLGLHSGKIQK